MPNLADTLAGFTGAGGEWQVEAPGNWMQGRTLYGGMTAALCHHAARLALPDLPPLRAAQFAFTGPATGRLSFTVSLLRRGRNSAVVSVSAASEAGPAASALLTCANARESAIAHDARPAPDVPGPEGLEDLHRGEVDGLSFVRNFDMKVVRGGRPGSGGPPELMIWGRLKEREGLHPETALLALGDCLPPGAMALFPQWGPISTMSWGVDLFQPVTGDGAGWHLLHTYSEQAEAGYSLQGSEMWDAAGRRIMVARQVVALFV